ncbi:uncharacterized protein LOC106472057 [Limulus polyphemus]|uniref:Uncharacterized protein LOC106472057 n=1 Tax=Limulus polyphemus TaxID=6850 RepID=A0ABM1BT41_LIMPO|nr:uncharacterized protein LOC106472057 [Limulus polyphemus]
MHRRRPSNLQELENIYKQEWGKIFPAYCVKLVKGYPKRLSAVIAVKGAPIFRTHDAIFGKFMKVKASVESRNLMQYVETKAEVFKDSNHRITRSYSSLASLIVLVKKKDVSIRFCVDYQKENEVTKKDIYSLPRIDSTLNSLPKWFSTLDL